MGLVQTDNHSVLVLEDDDVLASALRDFLEEEGWEVECAYSAGEAKTKLADKIFDLVLADYRLPDANALTVFDDIHTRSPLTKVMVMTGVINGEVAANSIQKGAADLIYKPFEIYELFARIQKLMEGDKISHDFEGRRKSKVQPVEPGEIIGDSPAIQQMFRLIERVARTKATVLLSGESGTGKELVALALHRQSSRHGQAFVAMNCAAIPEQLLEDELFGHVRGAYTDARSERPGKFEQAHGGTLFLDEIGNMPQSLQMKLLRVIEVRELQRLGSNETIKVNVRIVAASNSDLRDKVAKGEFREDLFYRLHVVPIHLPALRERKGDLPLLVNHFLKLFSQEYELPEKKLDPRALRKLLQHSWPGNVRELRNAVEFATVLSGDRTVLKFADFPALVHSARSTPHSALEAISLPEEGIDLPSVMAALERHLIHQSLERTGGNKGKAARLLHLKRTTLVEKLRRMSLLEECA
ncbi:MAG: sigma-54-dependent transcriptional regulator [Acidobacteriota bacterium]